jgi:hypothetical protein
MTAFFVSYDGDDRGDDNMVSHCRGWLYLLLVVLIFQGFVSPKSAFTFSPAVLFRFFRSALSGRDVTETPVSVRSTDKSHSTDPSTDGISRGILSRFYPSSFTQQEAAREYKFMIDRKKVAAPRSTEQSYHDGRTAGVISPNVS